MSIDWNEIEDSQYEFTRAQLEEFARRQPAGKFYAFALCCNAHYGEVLLSLNSEQSSCRSIEEHYLGSSPEELEGIRWSIGDWEFMEEYLCDDAVHPANASMERTVAAVKPFLDLIDQHMKPAIDCVGEPEGDAAIEEVGALEREFLARMCRVAIRLEQHHAFECLNTTPEFTIYVVDHDETDFDSWQRLIRERILLAPPWESAPWPIRGEHAIMASTLLVESLLYREAGKLREAAHILREGIARLPHLGSEPTYAVEGTDARLPLPASNAWARAYVAKAVSMGPLSKERQEPLLAKAEELDPRYPEIYYLRGKTLAGWSDETDSLEYKVAQLERAIELDPNEPRYHGLRGDIRIQPYHKDYQNALADLTRAHELEPTNGEWLIKRAEANAALGNHAAATRDCESLIALWNNRLDWKLEWPLIRIAELHMKTENYQPASEEFTRWIDHYDSSNRTHKYLLRRAECYRALGNAAAAAADEAYVKEHSNE